MPPEAVLDTSVEQATDTDVVESSSDSIDSLFYEQDTSESEQAAGTGVEDSNTPDDTDQSGNESPEGDATDDQGQQTVELSIDDIAAALGLKADNFEVSEDGQVMMRGVVDGQASTVAPEKLLESYQLREHLDKKTQEVNQQLEAYKEQQTQSQQQHAEKLQQADDMLNLALEELTKDFQGINWDELKQEDDGRYANLKMEFQERHQNIQSRLQQIQKERDDAYEARVNQLTAEADKLLVQHYPQWTDKAVAEKEMGALRSYGVEKMGFDKKMMDAVTDYRIFQLLEKAQKFDDLKDKKPEVTNMVRRAVKVSQGGKPKSKRDSESLSNEDFFYGSGAS